MTMCLKLAPKGFATPSSLRWVLSEVFLHLRFKSFDNYFLFQSVNINLSLHVASVCVSDIHLMKISLKYHQRFFYLVPSSKDGRMGRFRGFSLILNCLISVFSPRVWCPISLFMLLQFFLWCEKSFLYKGKEYAHDTKCRSPHQIRNIHHQDLKRSRGTGQNPSKILKSLTNSSFFNFTTSIFYF